MGSDAIIIPVKHTASSFSYSFSFLPKQQRDAIKIVYEFCRITDDIVDNKENTRSNSERLHKWRLELERALGGSSEYPVLNQLSSIALKFNIPVVHFYELIKGVEMDLLKNRYETFDELKDYCYYVASSVGLMCLGIFGSKNEKTREYAIHLGIALQLTNILRDVSLDAGYGRIYLPREDLRKFGCSESDILAKRATKEFFELMRFETERAESFFNKAQELLPGEDRRAMFAAKIMERIYYHTLLRIKKVNYDVFSTSVHVPKVFQILIAMKYWLKHRLFAV